MNINIRFCCLLVPTFSLLWSGLAAAEEDPNRFNRIFVPPEKRTETLAADGIHDPASPGLQILQEPKDAFKPLPKSAGGNYVNWVESLKKGKIKPLYHHIDKKAEAMPMDLKIVMEVKGTMPDVIFPHSEHTELLDCSICHPAIFTPKQGANRMTMAEIMLGQKCGVCHGSVAFPVTECRLCHAQNKAAAKKGKKAQSVFGNKSLARK